MLVGILEDEELTINIDENNNFLNTEEDLKNFTVCINSPWGQTDETYIIKYNCKDSYTEKDPNEPDWKCEYTVVGYEMITSILYGYGNTPQKALQHCIDIFQRLQREFNKENDSF